MTETTTERASEARERILQTADRLFYNEGIHAVGIQRIIAEASVTRVTLYRHFSSKDDLIAAYLDRQLRLRPRRRSTASSTRTLTTRARRSPRSPSP